MKRTIGFFLTILLFGACSSTQTAGSLNYPLTTIFSAIEKEMSMGVQTYSENHREFYSRPFIVIQADDAKEGGYRERGRAKVVVLGDSRPYNLEVEVSIERAPKDEEKVDHAYRFRRYDKELAKRLLNRIVWRVEKRVRDNNLIDDFKSF